MTREGRNFLIGIASLIGVAALVGSCDTSRESVDLSGYQESGNLDVNTLVCFSSDLVREMRSSNMSASRMDHIVSEMKCWLTERPKSYKLESAGGGVARIDMSDPGYDPFYQYVELDDIPLKGDVEKAHDDSSAMPKISELALESQMTARLSRGLGYASFAASSCPGLQMRVDTKERFFEGNGIDEASDFYRGYYVIGVSNAAKDGNDVACAKAWEQYGCEGIVEPGLIQQNGTTLSDPMLCQYKPEHAG